ncbi:MAG: lysozyme [Arcobacteraceae bacterium]
MGNMKVSEQLKDFIKNYEKLELKTYQDEAGVWTVGYGHTGKNIVKNMTITQSQADSFLSNDLSKFESTGLFKNLCQTGKINNTKGRTDEYRDRC